MANWRTYINGGFSGCMLLSYARDHCRERDVRIWLIPGERDSVGISDGTDAWIAPVSADCFSVNVKRLIDDLESGKGIPKPVPPSTAGRVRRRLAAEDDPPAPPARPRRALEAPAAATPSVSQPMPRRPRATFTG